MLFGLDGSQLLAALFALMSGSALMFTSRFPPRLVVGTADPHGKPLDFASREVREAIGDYATTSHGLPPIDSGCIGPREIYRVVRIPGESPGPAIAVDVDVSGWDARVATWLWADGAPGGIVWKRASEQPVDAATVEAIRSGVDSLLLSDAVAANDVAVLDAPEEVVETCRHARYHFYRRIGGFTAADQPFRLLVRSLLALSPQHTP